MNSYTLWVEGFSVNGSKSTASCLGTYQADTFLDAVKMYMSVCNDKSLFELDRTPPTYWGCRIYDNEADARKTYG